MEERRIDTTVCLCGVREAIATILNRAFGFYTRGKVVVEFDDDVCAMNRKIQEANAYMSGFDVKFTLMDFLDDRGRMDSPFKDWVLSYLDEVPDGSEDYDAHIVGVTDCGRYCTLRIESHVKESQHSYTDMDWYYWCARMSGWHGVRVILNREYSTSVLERHETRIFEYDGEQVRQTEIGPEVDLTRYVESLEKVSGTLGLDQRRRLEYIISDCEALRGSLQQKIDELKEELASL